MINFGEGVNLDDIPEDDLDHLFRWRNDFSVWRWCRQNDVLKWDNHVAWFKSLPSRKDIRMYGVYDKTLLVGVCGLTDIDQLNQRAEFSLYIAPEHQKKGYAKCALKTLVSHGFMNLNFNCIWGETFEGNHAAKLFESIGFKWEGTRKDFYFRSGRFIDAHLYSILKRDWVESPNFKKTQLENIYVVSDFAS